MEFLYICRHSSFTYNYTVHVSFTSVGSCLIHKSLSASSSMTCRGTVQFAVVFGNGTSNARGEAKAVYKCY